MKLGASYNSCRGRPACEGALEVGRSPQESLMPFYLLQEAAVCTDGKGPDAICELLHCHTCNHCGTAM